MAPRTRRRYSVCCVWKWRPEVHLETGGSDMLVLRTGWAAEGGEVGMWYVTASRPWRTMVLVFGGGGYGIPGLAVLSAVGGTRGCWGIFGNGTGP